MMNDKRIGKTILAMIAVLTCYFIAGAMVVVNELEGSRAKLVQGAFIWLSVLGVLIWYRIQEKAFSELGLKKWRQGTGSALFYCIPVLLVAFSGLAGGIETQYGLGYLFAALFLTIGVGFSEEIYFRGIICNMWREKGNWLAIVLSAVLFGCAHIMNICGGVSVTETILQIFFAFFYGVVFAIIYLLSDSVIPCIIVHTLHDFCSFIGRNPQPTVKIIIMVAQTIMLLIYMALLIKRIIKKERK